MAGILHGIVMALFKLQFMLMMYQTCHPESAQPFLYYHKTLLYMLRYEVGFSVLKFDGKSRTCKNAIFFDDFNSLIAWGINPCDYEYLSDIISKINKLISKEIHEYEWGGGERTWFLSKSDTTTVIDNFAWQDNIVVPTSEILEIILGRKQIMDKWKEDDVRDILSISFDKIKQKPISYIRLVATTKLAKNYEI